ncbi:DUF1127 domain-containing protein [Rhodobacteraceae bacterium CCMM004]|nr:DUF1127 domain-containing protein [Rhodobacteraceae bacterium CCMM004]
MSAFDAPRTYTDGNALSTRAYVLVLRALRTLIDWNNARQTRKTLGQLTDRELDDIGLIRGDIDSIAAIR